MRGLPCCCQDGSNPPSNQLRITEVLEECQAVLKSDYYTLLDSTSPPGCTQLPPVPIEGCTCGCSFSSYTRPSHTCNGFTYDYPYTPSDGSGSRTSTMSRVVLLDYLDQANSSGTGNWRFDDGTSIVVTNFSFNFTQVRLRYFNPTVPRLVPSATSGNGTYSCMDAVSTSTTPLYGWFWERGRYTSDISAMGVYGASATYAAWTIEITANDAIVRDGAGTIKYQWSLASYDIDGLRVAIDNTVELVGRRIALNAGTNLRTASAKGIPPQGPKTVGQGTATEAKIVLRSAGDELENYQIVGKAAYFVNTSNTLPVNVYDCTTEQFFSGTLSEFRKGYRRLPDSILGTSPPVYPPATVSPVTPPGSACGSSPPADWVGVGYGLVPGIGSDGLFGNVTAPVNGLIWEAEYANPTSTTFLVSAGTGSCIRYACWTSSLYQWFKFGYMLEVERI